MATEVMKTFSTLQQELSKAKEGLRSVDDHIKRLIGRDPEGGGGPPRIGLKRNASQLEENHGRGRGFPFPVGRGRRDPGGHGRPMDMEEGPPGIRRRLGDKTVFSRLSGAPPRIQIKDEDSHDEEEVQHKPVVSSRVIPQQREQPSKEEVLAAQGDERSKARNRRMFGALLGTLQKFRQEETLMREREDKRAQVEKRLEEAAKREKEEMKRERQELFFDRQRKKAEIRRIEIKMLRIKEQDEWEIRHRPLLNFIRTNTKPPIFFLPKTHNVKSEERLVASQKLIATMMEQKRALVQEELDAMDNRAKGRNEINETHHSEGEEEEMDVEDAGVTNLNSSLHEESMDEHNPHENPDKENRLRSVNVKVEKEPEQKITLAGKIVRPVIDNDKHNEGDRHNQRELRDPKDLREQHDRSRDKHREERVREREHDRDRLHDRNRDKDRDRDSERNRERVRERERTRFRERDRRMDREVKREDRKEEGRWDRKKERDGSNDMSRSQLVVVKEEQTKDKPKWEDKVQELSLISLPGESSPQHNDSHNT